MMLGIKFLSGRLTAKAQISQNWLFARELIIRHSGLCFLLLQESIIKQMDMKPTRNREPKIYLSFI
jgi:hypothetical protein